MSAYSRLKSFTKSILPNKLLFSFEPAIRQVLYIFYHGNLYHCNVCDAQLRKFIQLENGELICPKCGSNGRARRLWMLLQDRYLITGAEVLDFSPARCLYRKLKKLENIEYVSTDLSGDFVAEESYDITSIQTHDQRFDLIICYHVLEHIQDDLRAMGELYRVLKRTGFCLVQTPFGDGGIYEDFNVTSREERLKHFGQEDHVRVYSLGGLTERLKSAGFTVEILKFDNNNKINWGLNMDEKVLVCSK